MKLLCSVPLLPHSKSCTTSRHAALCTNSISDEAVVPRAIAALQRILDHINIQSLCTNSECDEAVVPRAIAASQEILDHINTNTSLCTKSKSDAAVVLRSHCCLTANPAPHQHTQACAQSPSLMKLLCLEPRLPHSALWTTSMHASLCIKL